MKRLTKNTVSQSIQSGRLDLKQLSVLLYKGKGPTGPGAGNWQNTLVPITGDDIVGMIFHGKSQSPAEPVEQGLLGDASSTPGPRGWRTKAR